MINTLSLLWEWLAIYGPILGTVAAFLYGIAYGLTNLGKASRFYCRDATVREMGLPWVHSERKDQRVLRKIAEIGEDRLSRRHFRQFRLAMRFVRFDAKQALVLWAVRFAYILLAIAPALEGEYILASVFAFSFILTLPFNLSTFKIDRKVRVRIRQLAWIAFMLSLVFCAAIGFAVTVAWITAYKSIWLLKLLGALLIPFYYMGPKTGAFGEQDWIFAGLFNLSGLLLVVAAIDAGLAYLAWLEAWNSVIHIFAFVVCLTHPDPLIEAEEREKEGRREEREERRTKALEQREAQLEAELAKVRKAKAKKKKK